MTDPSRSTAGPPLPTGFQVTARLRDRAAALEGRHLHVFQKGQGLVRFGEKPGSGFSWAHISTDKEVKFANAVLRESDMRSKREACKGRIQNMSDGDGA